MRSFGSFMQRAVSLAAVCVLAIFGSEASAAGANLLHKSTMAVTNIRAVAGDSSATVSWTAPSGQTVTGYSVIATRAVYDPARKGNVRVSTPPVNVTDPTQTTATLTGLSNGSWYDFTVTAYNSTQWYAVNTNNKKNGGMVKPSTLPTVVSNIQVTAGKKKITVSWNRANNGGDTQTFKVDEYVGGRLVTLVETKSGIKDNHLYPSVTFTGLVTTEYYSYVVTSTNANGSVVSDMSVEVRPNWQ